MRRTFKVRRTYYMHTAFKNTLVVCLLALSIWFACSDNFVDNPNMNQAPRTFVTIFSSSELNPIRSRVTLNWWGDDPDGVVVGFIYTFDNNAADVQTWNAEQPTAGWTFTEETQETFILTLTGSDTVYSLWVKAIDDDGALLQNENGGFVLTYLESHLAHVPLARPCRRE